MINLLSLILSVCLLKSTLSELCNGVEYNYGRWVEDTSLLQKPEQNFICCDGAARSNTNLSKFCPPGFDIDDHGCTCLHHHLKQNNIDPATATEQEYRYNVNSAKYKWKADKCELTTWNAYEFCQLLGTKKVLIMGDSTSNQANQILKSMIFQTNINDASLLKCANQIVLQMSDILVAPPINGGGGRGYSLSQTVIEEFYAGQTYDYLIFGGFHFNYLGHSQWYTGSSNATKVEATDPRFAGSALVRLQEHINIINKFFKKRGMPSPHMIYKSVSVPHDQCQAHYNKGPDTSITDEQQLENLNTKGLGKKYKWNEEMAVETALIKHFVGKNDMSVLRLFPLDSRPDGHPPEHIGDCLHYCAPGPLNIFPQIFQHFLKIGYRNWRNHDDIYNVVPGRLRRRY